MDLTFDFEENKEARKVVGLRLEIQKLPPYSALEGKEKADTTSRETGNEELVEKLLEMKLSRRQAQSRVKKYSSERILRNIELVK